MLIPVSCSTDHGTPKPELHLTFSLTVIGKLHLRLLVSNNWGTVQNKVAFLYLINVMSFILTI
jgi:hypothetical protein